MINITNNNLLNYKGWQYVLVHVDENRPLSAIADELDITYAHVSKIIKELESVNYVKVERKAQGSNLKIKLTEEGLKQRKCFQDSMLASQGERHVLENVFPSGHDFIDN